MTYNSSAGGSGSGTVTSVSGAGTVSGLTLTGTVTSSGSLTLGGTLAVTGAAFGSQTANMVLAAPNGSTGNPSFRALVAADVPTLNQNTTGSAATLTTGRTIGMTGDVVWTSASFNGSANVTGTAAIQAGVVTLAMQANVASGTVFYRKTAGAGAPEVQTLATLKTDLGLTGTNSGDQTITLTGDVTGTGTGSFAATIAGGAVTNTKLANVATATFKGRATAGTGAPEDLTGTQATALLDTFTSTLKGLAPASGGGTANFLRADGTWAAPPGGAGGSPGGSTTQIQFNDAGTFGGDADLTWDKTGNTLTLGGTDTGVILNGITNEPSAPSSGTLRYYAKSIAGRMVPKVKGPSGLDYPLQASLWQNNTVLWTPTTATAGVWHGTAGAGAGTYTTQLPTTTNLYTAMKRGRWANVVTTTNQVLGQRNTEAMFFRGSLTGQGGFFFFARCGFDVWTNGGRFFAGMHSATTVVSANPSALNNTVGFCIDDTDAGAISFLTRGTAATKAATGFTAASNKGYDIYIFCAPNSSQYTWRIVDFVAGTEASGTATATLPTNTTMLTAGVLASNAALTPVTSIQLGINRIYVETDY